MKKIIAIIGMVLLFVFTGCEKGFDRDNNKGPFAIRMENGREVLYSAEKPAKGWVETIKKDDRGREVVISKIKFDKGFPTGEYSFYDETGVGYLEAETSLKDGKYTGKIKLTNEDGTVENMDGEFDISSDWIISGKDAVMVRMYDDMEELANQLSKWIITGSYTGPSFEKHYKDYLKSGQWKEITGVQKTLDDMGISEFRASNPGDQMEIVGNYEKDKREGKWQFTDMTDHEVWTVHYKDGVLSGKCKCERDGKLILDGNYENGMRNGEWLINDSDGNFDSKGTYKNNEKDGAWTVNSLLEWNVPVKMFDNIIFNSIDPSIMEKLKSGTVISKGNYEDGLAVGIWKFENDSLKGEIDLSRGPLHGKSRYIVGDVVVDGNIMPDSPQQWVLRAPGKIIKWTTYHNQFEGKYGIKDDATQTIIIGNFRNGKLDGKRFVYDYKGNLLQENFYRNGKPAEPGFWDHVDTLFESAKDYF